MKGSAALSRGAGGSWELSTQGSLGLLLQHQRDVVGQDPADGGLDSRGCFFWKGLEAPPRRHQG